MVTAARPGTDIAGRDRLRYSNVAIFLHWTIAALILYNLISGLLRDELPRGFFVFHISSGVTILVLTLVRVAWRLLHRAPNFLPMANWERALAHGVHVLLYAGMVLMPLTGWAMVSANPPADSPGAVWAANNPPAEEAGEKPAAPAKASSPAQPGGERQTPRRRGAPMVWGLFKLPMIGPIKEVGRTPEGVPEQRELHETLETAHLAGGWIMVLLFLLHVSGALKHQLIDRQRELARMGLGRARYDQPDEASA